MRYAAALVLAAAAWSALTAAHAQDGFASTGATTVGVSGNVVTITVKIDLLLGGLGETELPEGAQEEANGVAAEIAAYWNQGLARYASECVELRIAVDIDVLPTGELRIVPIDGGRVAAVTRPGRHVVTWGVNNYGNAAPPVTLDPYDDDGYAPPGEDYQTPFEHELEATWSPQLEDARDFAHEFGHLLGFGDDYGEGGEALPGREGTLMADGDLIDAALAGRLAELARRASSDVPECEVWEGTVSSRWDGSQCTGGQSGTITLEVAGTTVSGRSTTSGRQNCPDVPFSQGGPQTATLTGERSGGAFLLQVRDVTGLGDATSGCWGTPERPIPITISGDTATASFEWTFGLERYRCELELERQAGDSGGD